MLKQLAITSILLLLSMGYVHGQGDTARVFSYGGGSEDEARSILQTNDQGFLLVGSTSSFGNGSSDIYVIKLDSVFQIQWSNTYGGPQIEWAESAIQTPDGGYLVAGATNSYGNGGYDCYLVKIESDGTFEYSETFGGGDWDYFHKVIRLSNGDALFLGEKTNITTGFVDAFALRLNVFGIPVWEKSYPSNGNSTFRSAHLKGTNEILVAGSSSAESDSLDLDIYLVSMAYDGSLNAEYFYGGNLDEEAFDIEIFNNETYLAGYSKSTSLEGDENEYLLRLDSTYAMVWERDRKSNSSGINLDDRAYAIHIRPSNDILMTGVTYTYGSGNGDVIISHLESSGYEYPTSGSTGGRQEDIGFDIIPRNDVGLIIVGKSKNYGSPYSNVFLMVMDTIRRITMPDNPSQVKYINVVDTLPASQPNSIQPRLNRSGKAKMNLSDFVDHARQFESCTVLDIQGRTVINSNAVETIELMNSLKSGFYFMSARKKDSTSRFKFYWNQEN